MQTADQPKALFCQGSGSKFEPCIPIGLYPGLDSNGGFSRETTYRLEMAGSLRGPPCRGHRNHDHAKRQHRQSHEFETQGVHGSILPLLYSLDLEGAC
jgi:hypothetical protein